MIKEEDIKKPETIAPSRFTFNANIINEIGEESISNPFIAIAELIKNSYDADSQQVSINFSNLDKHNKKIIISDDGIGMDSDQLNSKWLDIGSPHKKAESETQIYERVPVGAKGIGRFAAQCLGHSMKLITTASGQKTGHKLSLNWEKFKSPAKATDIDLDHQKFKKKSSTHGTAVVIERLKHEWNSNETLKTLATDINLLTSPIDHPQKFKIKENISDLCEGVKKLDTKFLEKAGYHANIILTKPKEISIKFYKNNALLVSKKEVIDKDLNCGKATFDLYFYYKSAAKWKEYMGTDPSKKDIEEISTMLDLYGGIKLYRDGFRVKPYGDRNADWIGLDKWSRDQSTIPGNTQVIGIVSISKETNPKIEDTTSREGIISKPEFFDLIEFVSTGVDLFRQYRLQYSEDTKRKRRRAKKVKVISPKVSEPAPAIQEQGLIEVIGLFPNSHYHPWINEINNCNRHNLPNAAFCLSRKVVENLLSHILYKKFPRRPELWYDTANHRHHSLSTLIKNIFTEKDQFKPRSKELIESFNTDVSKFKKDADAAMHRNQAYLSDKSELKAYKINKLVQILIDVYQDP